MTIKSNPCKHCNSSYHTRAFCDKLPRKALKQTVIKRKTFRETIFDKKAIETAMRLSIQDQKKAMKKSTKKKSPSRSQLVKKLDTIFSQYIRLYYANEFGEATCVTCGTTRNWKEMQNGHYESRGHLPTRWLVDNCHVQDAACNVFKKGNYTEYAIYMVNRYGADKLTELKTLANSGEKVPTVWIKDQIEYYTTEVERIKKQKGLAI